MPRGLSQAEATARSLARAGQRFAALYSSDLERARQTAAAIARAHALAATHDARLRERHYGVLPGPDLRRGRAPPPESLAAASRGAIRTSRCPTTARAWSASPRACTRALEDIAGRHAGETVVVVTHGGVLDIAHRLATGQPLETARDFAIPNAALNWIEHSAGSWRLIAWADESHLHGALDELPGT